MQLATTGHDVTVVDSDAERVALLADGVCPIHEPGLPERLRALPIRYLHTGQTEELVDAFTRASATVICVPTPNVEGRQNTRAVQAAIAAWVLATTDSASGGMPSPLVVIKSTILPGTCEAMTAGVRADFDGPYIRIVHMPEFLAEGTAVKDALAPARCVIGFSGGLLSSGEQEVLRRLVPHCARNRIQWMSWESAEMAKYACNFALANRISMINQIARLCDNTGANVDDVRQVMGADPRIGSHYLRPGIGWGGSCFPKDLEALSELAGDGVLRGTIRTNDSMLRWATGRLQAQLTSFSRVTLWGVAFKPGTSDIRESPALPIIDYIESNMGMYGGELTVSDPHGIQNFAATLDPGHFIKMTVDYMRALEGAVLLVICTDWPEYQAVPVALLKQAMGPNPTIIDGRNLWPVELFDGSGIRYVSVGRPTVGP